MIPLKSSNLAGYVHDPATGDLTVSFRNGSRYRYANVPIDVVSGLAEAKSPGSYLAGTIRGKFDAKRLDTEDEPRR